MRTEKEMYDLIIGTAKNDERIRAVSMCGSRCDPNAPEDEYRDYDIEYVVRDISSFTKNHDWIKIFGSPLMVQMPELYEGAADNGCFAYLMLFDDGVRIDLTLIPVEKLKEIYDPDCLNKILLDKDGIMHKLPPTDDSSYHIKPLTAMQYDQYCNNFWWIMQNTVKGIMRDELPYAMKMLTYSRSCLEKIIECNIGIRHDFKVTAGKFGKYYKNYLTKQQFADYLATYPQADSDGIWQAVFTMCRIFPPYAKKAAQKLGFHYRADYEENMTAYLRMTKGIYDKNKLS